MTGVAGGQLDARGDVHDGAEISFPAMGRKHGLAIFRVTRWLLVKQRLFSERNDIQRHRNVADAEIVSAVHLEAQHPLVGSINDWQTYLDADPIFKECGAEDELRDRAIDMLAEGIRLLFAIAPFRSEMRELLGQSAVEAIWL